MTQEKQSFWDHLDILRAAIIRIAAVTGSVHRSPDFRG